MPVAQKVGPDGCLYILDWYDRYHCYQDANRDPAGIDRLKGRLYRVRYRDSPRAPRFDLATEDDEALVRRLGSPNIYFRESAQRLLTERNTVTVRERLERLVLDASAPRKARLHGLWALIGTGALEPAFHARLLDDADPAYRAWGVRAAGDAKAVTPALRDRIAGMVEDASPDVLLQLAIAARKIEGLDALPLLVAILSRCGEDRLIPAIAWQNLHPLLPAEGERFARLTAAVDLGTAPALAKLLPRAVDRLLGEPEADPEPVRAILERLIAQDRGRAQECLAVISERAREMTEARREALRGRLEPILGALTADRSTGSLNLGARLLESRLGAEPRETAAVRDHFLAAELPEGLRLQALDALVAFEDPGLPEAAGVVLASGSPGLLTRVLAGLGRADDPKLAEVVLAAYPTLDPAVQPLAIDLLLQRESWARKLLDRVLTGTLPRSTLNANHLRKILESNDREAIWAVEKAWGTIRPGRNPEREKVVAEMGDYFRRHPGDPQAGRAVFRKLCAQCHTIYGEGATLGPDLTSSGRGSFDQLLASVFDPSLVIGESYRTTTVVTEDGRNLTGLVTEDSDRRIELALPGGGREVIARNDVKSTRTSALSMMPEGIETLLHRRELADLFAFLALDHPPDDPRARPIPGAPERKPVTAGP
jgi:putative heme-binding domain-containing protein